MSSARVARPQVRLVERPETSVAGNYRFELRGPLVEYPYVDVRAKASGHKTSLRGIGPFGIDRTGRVEHRILAPGVIHVEVDLNSIDVEPSAISLAGFVFDLYDLRVSE